MPVLNARVCMCHDRSPIAGGACPLFHHVILSEKYANAFLVSRNATGEPKKKVEKSLNQRSENHVRHQLGCSETIQVESSIETYGIVVQ